MPEETPDTYEITHNGKTISVKKGGDGREYLTMKSAASYIGRSRYKSDLLINERVEAGTMHQYEFVGHAIYVPREELDALENELSQPKPLPPRGQRRR